MDDRLRRHLTPDQIEKLEDGWHVAVVLGPSDLDVMHCGLTLDYCDTDTKRLWDNIAKQVEQIHFLNRMARAIQ